jgi:hypothetical protein
MLLGVLRDVESGWAPLESGKTPPEYSGDFSCTIGGI